MSSTALRRSATGVFFCPCPRNLKSPRIRVTSGWRSFTYATSCLSAYPCRVATWQEHYDLHDAPHIDNGRIPLPSAWEFEVGPICSHFGVLITTVKPRDRHCEINPCLMCFRKEVISSNPEGPKGPKGPLSNQGPEGARSAHGARSALRRAARRPNRALRARGTKYGTKKYGNDMIRLKQN